MIDAKAFRGQAREVAAERLLNARGLLTAVAPAERAVIEQVAYAVAAGVASCPSKRRRETASWEPP